MSEYFWQGGKKIPISPSANQITIQADSEVAVSDLASDAGVSLQNVEKVAEGVVTAKVTDRDSSMKKLRENAIVHHVYHAPEEPASEYLIDDTFYIKFMAHRMQGPTKPFPRAQRGVSRQTHPNTTTYRVVKDEFAERRSDNDDF